MKSNHKPSVFAESKRPGTGFTRTSNPNNSQTPGGANRPNPNFTPPPTVKKSK